MSLDEQDDLNTTLQDAAAEAGSSARTTEEVTEPKPLRTELSEAFKEARDRDEQGRFKAREAAEAAGKTQAAQAAAAGTTPPANAAAPALTWKNPASAQRWEQAEWLKTLAPEVRTKALADIARREDEVHVGMTKQDEERSFGRDMQKAVAPYAAMIASEGVTAAQAVQSLFNTAYVLRAGQPDQKVAALAQVVKQYGIPVDRLAQSLGLSAAGVEGGQPNAEVLQLRQQVEDLNTQLTRLTTTQAEREKQEVAGELAKFQADPANVHFDKVRAKMGQLISSGMATSLKDAYEQACYLDPEIRSSLTAEEVRKAEEKRRSEQQAQAEAARRKAVSVRGGPGVTAPTSPNGSNSSLREQIRSSLAEVTGRV